MGKGTGSRADVRAVTGGSALGMPAARREGDAVR